MPYSSLEDKDLFDRLNKAQLCERLMNEEHWGLLQEASDRIVDKAIAEFAIKTDPSDLSKIIQLQVIIKKYKYGLFSEIEQIAQEGRLVFDEVRERGKINDLT